MSTDIHAYIEEAAPSWEDYWFCVASLHLHQDYRLFEALAGVRGELINAIVPPRGLPSPVSWLIRDAATLLVEKRPSRRKVCSVQDAEMWVKEGRSIPIYGDKEGYRITDPDWHTFSYLMPHEVQEAAKRLPDTPMIEMIAAMMKPLPIKRFVFWFDN